MPLECPQPGCDGHLDEGSCTFCGKTCVNPDHLQAVPPSINRTRQTAPENWWEADARWAA